MKNRNKLSVLYNFYFLSLSVLAEAFIILLTDQSIDIFYF